MKLGLQGALAATVLIFAPAGDGAWARGPAEQGMTAAEISDWLRGQGLSAEVRDDPTNPGQEVVRSSADGVGFNIYLYGCDARRAARRRCSSIQYAAGWTSAGLSAERINRWDREARFVRAYVTPKGGVFVEFDLDLAPGQDRAALDQSLQRWRSAVSRFRAAYRLP